MWLQCRKGLTADRDAGKRQKQELNRFAWALFLPQGLSVARAEHYFDKALCT
jgi:hypothetical protein